MRKIDKIIDKITECIIFPFFHFLILLSMSWKTIEQLRQDINFIDQQLLELITPIPTKPYIPRNIHPKISHQNIVHKISNLFFHHKLYVPWGRWDMLSARCFLVEKIGILKKEQHLTVFQEERKNALENMWKIRWWKQRLSEEFIITLYHLVHELSVQIQIIEN